MDAGYPIGVYALVSLTIIEMIFLINWSLTFFRLWRLFSIKSINIRRPTAVLWCCLFSIAGMLRTVTQLLFSFDLVLFNNLYLIQSIFMGVTAFALFYAVVYRTWLIFYDIKFNQALESIQWQCHIDTKTLNSSWFIQHRRKWRNPKRVGITLAIPLCFFTLISAASIIVKGRNPIALLMMALNLLTPLVLLLILICKMPRYDDHYKLRKEAIIVAYIVFFGLLSSFPLLIGLKSGPGMWKWIPNQFVQIHTLFFVSTISTFWVFRSFNLPTIYCMVRQESFLELEVRKTGDVTATIASSSHSSARESKSQIELVDVLKDDELFNLFATHLSKEFCIENILYFVETHQFGQYLSEHFDVSAKSISPDIEVFQLTAGSIPQSTIVRDLRDGGELNDAAVNLFSKYIDYDDAYFCVNISHESRQAMYEVIGYLEVNASDSKEVKQEAMKRFMKEKNITATQIYEAVHQTRVEIYALLLSSSIRFKINK